MIKKYSPYEGDVFIPSYPKRTHRKRCVGCHRVSSFLYGIVFSRDGFYIGWRCKRCGYTSMVDDGSTASPNPFDGIRDTLVEIEDMLVELEDALSKLQNISALRVFHKDRE